MKVICLTNSLFMCVIMIVPLCSQLWKLRINQSDVPRVMITVMIRSRMLKRTAIRLMMKVICLMMKAKARCAEPLQVLAFPSLLLPNQKRRQQLVSLPKVIR
eukprot:Lithocolla_globosa_v1_NODE_62_length_7247_cov_17.118503.p7 type:complete len:102 gc:universal NODE_62_length_7247_cov_17.118503:2040-2345(+)